jgi:hypothetical protein
VRLSPLRTSATTGLLYQPQMIEDGDCGAIDRMKIGRGKPKHSEKICSSATFSTTWPNPGSNPGHHGGIQATNRLSCDTDVSLSMSLQLRWLYPMDKIWDLRNHELQVVTHWLVQLSSLYNGIENFLSHSSSVVIYWLFNNFPIATCWFVAAARCFGCRCQAMTVSFDFHVTICIVTCKSKK